MNNLIVVIILMLLGSAFFSAVEAAFFSTTLNRAKILAEEGKKEGSKYLLKIKREMRPTITVLVIFNNIFNIGGSIFVGAIATDVFGSSKIGIFSAILTFLVVVFGEIIPKSIGESFSSSMALFVAKPLFYVTKVFTPFIALIEFFTKSLPEKRKTVCEEEIRSLSNIGFLEGVIEEDEKEMIHRVFLLNDLTVKSIMTPRTVVTAFESNKKLSDIKEEVLKLTHSRIPVYEKNLDNIIGICHQRDLLIALASKKTDKNILHFANKKITIVYENQKIDDLIPVFRKTRCHLAVVKDDFGGTSGIITLEDVLEQIIGSVIDETDETANLRETAKRK